MPRTYKHDEDWFRLCVDVTRLGEVIGASWEQHAGEDAIRIGVLGLEWPLMTLDTALVECRRAAEATCGVQLELWP